MPDKRTTLAIILLIAGLIVGGGIGYYVEHQKIPPFDLHVPNGVLYPTPLAAVKLGYIATDTTALEVGKPYHEQIIAADLHNYATILGYGTVFTYVVDDAQGQDNMHLEKVQGLKSIGVTVFEGGGWSSQAQAALNYCNLNGMLMWSTSSTSPALAIAADNLFRMCPADTHLAPTFVNVMWATGVRNIVIIQRGDSWGDGMVSLVAPLWSAKGGEITGNKVRYATNATDFTGYLATADQEVRDAVTKNGGDTPSVGLVMLSLKEISLILKHVSDYPNIYNVHWWWINDDTTAIQSALDDTPNEANHVGIYTLLPSVTTTPLYNQLAKRYENLTGQQFSSNQAYSYDISSVISNSIYQTQGTSGAVLVPLQKPTADQMFGSTGSLRLDESGDRLPQSYDIFSFYPSATREIVSVSRGHYYPDAEAARAGDGTVLFPEYELGPRSIGP